MGCRQVDLTLTHALIHCRGDKYIVADTFALILDVSMEVGFDSTAYFIKRFKKQTGTTPLRWRISIK